MILENQLHPKAPVQLLAERSCGTSLLRRGLGSESEMTIRIQLGGHYRRSLIRGYAIVDVSDADLALVRWSCHTNGYAIRKTASRKNERMHRVVLERKLGRTLATDELTDHINGDRLDNRRSNLRATNDFGNMQSRPIPSNNTSGYRGVIWTKGRWVAQVRHNKKHYYCGTFDNPHDAAIAAQNKRTELGFLTRDSVSKENL